MILPMRLYFLRCLAGQLDRGPQTKLGQEALGGSCCVEGLLPGRGSCCLGRE
jgi:hypothetical protein